MCSYSSVKLEMAVLKWEVTEKFCDYFLASRFQVCTDNNLLVHVQESKLSTPQIWLLSELASFDLTIKYQSIRSNKSTNVLTQCKSTHIYPERAIKTVMNLKSFHTKLPMR